MTESSPNGGIRLLVLLEGTTVSGPARNVLQFCPESAATPDLPAVRPTIAAFVRDSQARSVEVSNQLLEAAAARGVTVRTIRERFPFDPVVLPALRNLVDSLQPHIIETHHVKSHFLVRLSGVWRNRPWLAFHHGYTRDARRTLLYNQLDRWSLAAASLIVTVCQPFCRELARRGIHGSRITVVHNAISADWLDLTDPEVAHTTLPDHCRRSKAAEKIVLAVGRLSQEKAFADLVTAMATLRRRHPEVLVRLLIAGDGPEKTALQRQVHRMNFQDRVFLLGHVRDLRPFYRTADVLAISSISEGSPNVLLEAMAAGVPVVATTVGGIPEIVAHRETALLVEPQAPEAMASALQLLLSDPALARRLASNARRLIQDLYSPQLRAQRLLNLYQQIYRQHSAMVRR